MLLAGRPDERAKQELNSTVRWKSKQTPKSEQLFWKVISAASIGEKNFTCNMHRKMICPDENTLCSVEPTDTMLFDFSWIILFKIRQNHCWVDNDHYSYFVYQKINQSQSRLQNNDKGSKGSSCSDHNLWQSHCDLVFMEESSVLCQQQLAHQLHKNHCSK